MIQIYCTDDAMSRHIHLYFNNLLNMNYSRDIIVVFMLIMLLSMVKKLRPDCSSKFIAGFYSIKKNAKN